MLTERRTAVKQPSNNPLDVTSSAIRQSLQLSLVCSRSNRQSRTWSVVGQSVRAWPHRPGQFWTGSGRQPSSRQTANSNETRLAYRSPHILSSESCLCQHRVPLPLPLRSETRRADRETKTEDIAITRWALRHWATTNSVRFLNGAWAALVAVNTEQSCFIKTFTGRRTHSTSQFN